MAEIGGGWQAGRRLKGTRHAVRIKKLGRPSGEFGEGDSDGEQKV